MLFNFLVKKNRENVSMEESCNLPTLYLNNLTHYIDYVGKISKVKNPNSNEEFFNRCAKEYYDYANYFAEYLRDNYPDTCFGNENVINIDIENMMVSASDEAKRLFIGPTYPELIYIGDGTTSPHFHAVDGFIEEAENIQCLPGLSRVLATQKINKLFNGLSLVEGHALLKQMNILPKHSELSMVVNNFGEFYEVHRKFLESIIYLLLIKRNKYSIERARLFADTFNIEFDFTPFEIQEEKHKELLFPSQ